MAKDFISDDEAALLLLDDPQAAVAAQGLTQAAPVIAQGAETLGQSALQNLRQASDVAGRAGRGDPQAMEQLAQQHAGMVAGTVGAIPRIKGTLGVAEKAVGFNDKVAAAKELLLKAEEGLKAGILDHTDVAFAMQKLKTAERLANRNKFAEGGEVELENGDQEEYWDDATKLAKGTPSMYPPVQQLPVSGTPVSAQMSADFIPDAQFDKMTESQPMVDNSAHIQTQGTADFIPDAQFVSDEAREAELQSKYGTIGQQAKAAVEGLGQGLLGPIAPGIEVMAGVDPEAIRLRQEANPLTHYGTEALGLIGPALVTGGASAAGRGTLAGLAKFTQAGALESVGKAVSKALPMGETLAAKIGPQAARMAVENGLFSGSDEISKMIINDPNQTAETAIAHVGLGAALGGGLGVLGAGASHLIEKQGPKVTKFIENMRGRLSQHVENPDPVAAVGKELGEYHSKIEALHDDVYGPRGLKSQDISKALPEMNEKIATQAQETYQMMNKAIQKMAEKPNSFPPRLVDKLQGDLDAFEMALSREDLKAADVFNAKQDLKQTLQQYAKFDRHVTPVSPEYDFVQVAKGLSNKLRTSLENPEVWGKAGERQAAINKAFSEYLPALKDFQKKFTTELNGERVIDPGKINTYVSQLDKPNAEIKKEVLKNFMDATEKYKKVIHDSHVNLGIESPVTDAAMNNVLGTLEEKTSGAKVADFIAHKFAPEALGTSAGASIGGMIAGAPGAAVGALIGSHSLAPFFNKALPAIAGFLLKAKPNPVAAKAAVDYAMAAVKGEMVLDKSIKAMFKEAPETILPREIETAKLDKMLRKIQVNPDLLFNQTPNPAAHYMPNQVAAINQTNASAVNYLNSLRPDEDKQSPFDSKPVANNVQRAKYENALKIAQDPYIIVDKIRQGMLTADDISTIGTLYPSLYNSMKSKMVAEAIDVASKGQTIPYKTRIGMSMFMGQPLDSTMQPAAIQAAQTQPPGESQEQQNQQPQASKGVKSSPALQKMPSMYRTPGQTRAGRAQKD